MISAAEIRSLFTTQLHQEKASLPCPRDTVEALPFPLIKKCTYLLSNLFLIQLLEKENVTYASKY